MVKHAKASSPYNVILFHANRRRMGREEETGWALTRPRGLMNREILPFVYEEGGKGMRMFPLERVKIV